ncbi:MAG: hypothetical protein Q8Q54_04960 [Methylococcales bacterium]|nr:hypothetical protein [Methylococcales bacterium]
MANRIQYGIVVHERHEQHENEDSRHRLHCGFLKVRRGAPLLHSHAARGNEA